jgi:hypothetical protein
MKEGAARSAALEPERHFQPVDGRVQEAKRDPGQWGSFDNRKYGGEKREARRAGF